MPLALQSFSFATILALYQSGSQSITLFLTIWSVMVDLCLSISEALPLAPVWWPPCPPPHIGGGGGGTPKVQPVTNYMRTQLAYSVRHLTNEKFLISTWKFWSKELELFVILLNLQSWWAELFMFWTKWRPTNQSCVLSDIQTTSMSLMSPLAHSNTPWFWRCLCLPWTMMRCGQSYFSSVITGAVNSDLLSLWRMAGAPNNFICYWN